MADSSFRPNDQMRLPGIGVPVDPLTGFQIDPRVMQRVGNLIEAEKIFRQVLHDLDGTTMGSRPGDRRMAQAFIKLEEVMMWAQLAILDR